MWAKAVQVDENASLLMKKRTSEEKISAKKH